MVLGYFGFGHIIYVSLLFTNAIAILNEERFLAKSQCHSTFVSIVVVLTQSVGWSTRTPQNVNVGFGNVPHNPNVYDGTSFGGGGGEGVSIKSKLVNLISATRTLMRSELSRHDLHLDS